MKKLSFLTIFLVQVSCQNMEYCNATQWKQQEAQSMYNAFGTSIIEMSPDNAEKLFGSCHRNGDEVYVYNTLWNKKYILARYGKAITYVEDNGQITAKGAANDKYKNYNRGGAGVPQNQMQQSKNVKWF